ncbi:MAG TPA: DUF3488 and transglutaminase-like domain-containing protein [Gammaproteobacteria bacterium]
MSAAAQPLPSAATPFAVRRLLWTAGIVLGASLPHWLELPFWIPVLLAVCLGWRLAVAMLGWRPPPRALRLAFALLAFVGVLLEYGTVNGVRAGSALLVVMVALKFLEANGQRDELVLMIISYFLVFASLLYDQTLFTVAYLFAFVWVTTVALLQLGRRAALLPSRSTFATAGRMLLRALPVMVVLFVLFPRLPGSLWGMPRLPESATTGLSDTMSPGDITRLGLSEEIAFRVEFRSRPPLPRELYWRGPVLDTFDGRTWSQGDPRRRNVARTLEHRGEPVSYRVMLEPEIVRFPLALDMPAEWSGQPGMRMGSDYRLRMFTPEAASRIEYEVTSYTDYRALEPLLEVDFDHYTYLPEGSNPRIRALAAEWLADDPTHAEIVERALAFFQSREFLYTLTPPPLGRHAADEFVFDTQRGFCEHYASAFAVMMRAAGVPARIVTGYQGGELNELGGYYIVRQSDAHAWTEVWLPERGWVRIDPTAAVAPARVRLGSSLPALSDAASPRLTLARMRWVRALAHAWDAANMHFNRWVLGFGPELQRELLRLLGFAEMRRAQRWQTLLALTVCATALLSLALAFMGREPRRPRHHDPARKLFTAFVRRLARLHVPPPAPTESPSDYALRASRAVPHLAAHIDAVVAAYLQARYEPDANGEALERLRARVRGFRPSPA